MPSTLRIPWIHQGWTPAITNSRSLLKLASIESVMPSNHLILCRPHLLLPSIFPSIRVFRPSISRGQTARTGSQGLV